MKTTILAITILTFTGFIFTGDIRNYLFQGAPIKHVKEIAKATRLEIASAAVSVKEKWDLPAVLKEVSGIAYIDKDRFACVQDEAGTIYIFNRMSAQIEKEIIFTGPGDFEGITLNGHTAYIVRSDGLLYEVDMNTKKTTEYKTGLPIENNLEGLCYDSRNNRLLIAGKADDQKYAGYKVIYAFDILKKTMAKAPVFKIYLGDKLLQHSSAKKNSAVMLSEIAINPITNDIFITDGPKSRLLILDNAAAIKKVYELGSQFVQPEGITFSPQGDLYISNEGKKSSGNIIKVGLE